MKKLTRAQLFIAPPKKYNAEAKLERARLAVIAARSRALETTKQQTKQPLRVRLTVLQRRRLAERVGALRAE
jgi:hypothetical protein